MEALYPLAVNSFPTVPEIHESTFYGKAFSGVSI